MDGKRVNGRRSCLQNKASKHGIQETADGLEGKHMFSKANAQGRHGVREVETDVWHRGSVAHWHGAVKTVNTQLIPLC
eukprot:775610-Alexandrium_andersonii.AAC.1